MVEAGIENEADIDRTGLRLGYFTNEYPAPSHTFIRREMHAIEALGVPITRFALRAGAKSPADGEELAKTRYLLRGGVPAVFGHMLRVAIRRPLRFVQTLAAAVRLSRGSNRGLLTHFAYVAQACVLRNLARGAGITHLHVHFASNPAAIAMLCEKLGGPRWSLTVHGPEEFDDPKGFSLREKIVGASFVAGISEFTVAALRSIARADEAPKIHVVRCGVDDAYLRATPTPIPAERRLVCVGRLSGRKRQLLLIRALADVVARGIDARLTLVGDGPTREDVEREIAADGVSGRVLLAGWRDEQGVRESMESSRALVLPSSSEGLPVVIMEAFALGRPVIATPVAGVPELVEHGVNGWLVPVDDVEALAQAIEEAMSLPADRLAAMGESGRRKVLELHDVRRSAQRLVTLIARHILSDVG